MSNGDRVVQGLQRSVRFLRGEVSARVHFRHPLLKGLQGSDRGLAIAVLWARQRMTACEETEREWAEKYGAETKTGRLGCATERNARSELALMVRDCLLPAMSPAGRRALTEGGSDGH